MLLSYTIVDFHLFYDEAVDINICAPLTRSQCKVCDTQVTVKVCGSLVSARDRYSEVESTGDGLRPRRVFVFVLLNRVLIN